MNPLIQFLFIGIIAAVLASADPGGCPKYLEDKSTNTGTSPTSNDKYISLPETLDSPEYVKLVESGIENGDFTACTQKLTDYLSSGQISEAALRERLLLIKIIEQGDQSLQESAGKMGVPESSDPLENQLRQKEARLAKNARKFLSITRSILEAYLEKP